jgi:glutamate dehydrogenase (NAD(P)+)
MTGKSIVDSQFERAANLINLDDYMRRILQRPFREVQVEVPVRMDDGRIEVFTGFRIQHNGARGPCKGGSGTIPRRTTTRYWVSPPS